MASGQGATRIKRWTLWWWAYRRSVNWVLDADIKAFFDTVDHAWMMRFLEHRIGDTRVLRLIRKWLTAGVVENGNRTDVWVGTPQGAVISPLLANIYLHYVFDLWAHRWRGRHAGGDVMIVRYADDSVLGFESKSNVDRFIEDMKLRFVQFGLTLNEDKTRVLQFGRFAAQARAKQGLAKPPTFDFLGLTHICGKSRSNGWFQLKRLTSAKQMRARLKAIREALMRRMHEPVLVVGRWLRRVVQGYFNYHAVPGNVDRLDAFRKDGVSGVAACAPTARAAWTNVLGPVRASDRALPPAGSGAPSVPASTLCVMTQGRSRMR